MNDAIIGMCLAAPVFYALGAYTWPWFHAKFIAVETIAGKIKADL